MKPNRREFLAGAAAASILGVLGRNPGAFAERKRFKACIIGDSKQGGYGHGLHLVWSGRENIEVLGIADPDEEGRAKHAAESGAKRAYADYREMLEKEKPDLVSIGPRWTIHHKEYLLACAEAGAHGYLEKPISTDLAEADAMVEAVESKNLKWSIAHQKRICPDVVLAKKLIFEEGLIGDILDLRGRGKEDHRAGGEDLIVLGTHIFDLMLHFMGRPEWCMADVSVDGRPAVKEDIRQPSEPLGPILGNQIHSTFGFANATPGSFATRKNRDGNGGRWGLDIYGSKGIAKIRMETYPEIFWKETSSWLPTGDGQPEWKRLPGHVELSGADPSAVMNAYAIDDLLEAIEQNREPGVSLRSGRDSYEMIQAVYAAHINGGRIDLPLADRRHPLLAW